jgi:Alpha/beta hydrolase family
MIRAGLDSVHGRQAGPFPARYCSRAWNVGRSRRLGLGPAGDGETDPPGGRPDLPSHRSPDAGLVEDVDEVQSAILSSPAPTVVVGWSYGCDVVGVAAHSMPNVTRLIYVSSVPLKIHIEARDAVFLDTMKHMLRDGHGRLALDNHWWLHEDKAGRQLPPVVRAHLESNPRRFATTRTLTDPIPAAAWTEIATTILLGTADTLTDSQQRAWAREAVADVRDMDSDHFILFNRPNELADVILEELR